MSSRTSDTKKRTAEERLPRTFMSAIRYGLVLQAHETEWVAYYGWGDTRFADFTAHGSTIEEALNEMLYVFENYEQFENLRDLLK